MFEDFDRLSASQAKEYLEKITVKLLRDIKPPCATLRLIRIDGDESKLAVSKDYYDCSSAYRHTIGRFLLSREYAAYKKLEGIPGIPKLLCRPNPYVLCIEFIKGRDLRLIAQGNLPMQAIDQLQAILEAMHSRKVIHLDIGHDSNGDYGRETNLLWSEEEQKLSLIDFAGAWLLPAPKSIFNLLAKHDRLAITKIKRKFFPELAIPPEDEPTDFERKFYRKLHKL